MRKYRIACVHIRDFGLALWLREDPERRRHPAVLVEKEAAAAPLLAIGVQRDPCYLDRQTSGVGHPRGPPEVPEVTHT